MNYGMDWEEGNGIGSGVTGILSIHDQQYLDK